MLLARQQRRTPHPALPMRCLAASTLKRTGRKDSNPVKENQSNESGSYEPWAVGNVLMGAMQQIAGVPFVIFDEPEHIGTVQPEYRIWRDRAPALHRGYLDAIASLAHAGNHVAVPAAGHDQAEFVTALGDVPTLTVGLTCELEVLVARERRTGRWGGIATDSMTIHQGWTYDLEFDTTDEPNPLDIARHVLNRLQRLGPSAG